MANPTMFSWYHYLIFVLPLAAVCGFAIYTRRYVRSVADYLVAGRCAGRYLLRSAGMMTALSAATLVSYTEIHLDNGWMYAFWNSVITPISIMLTFYGWISYRFRETKAMTAGQFFEMRYSRGFRRLAAVVRGSADLLSNCIGPAVAVRFLIYLMGIPHRMSLFGFEVRTFPFLLALCLGLALLVILCGGRIALLVTDSLQGLFSYPIFLLVAIYVLTRFSFWDEIAPVMGDRVAGESFVNPYDIQNLRDFNLFGLVVVLMRNILGGSWIGNGYVTVAKSPHEGKMAGILSFFGAASTNLMLAMLAMACFAILSHERHADTAREIRAETAARAIDELAGSGAVADAVNAAVGAVPAQRHRIGVDPPLSRASNLATPTLEAAHGAMLATLPEKDANALYQGFRATFRQQTLPMVVRHVFPPWLAALLVLLVLLLMLSTDDTRVFDTTTTWMQDFVLPFFRHAPSQRLHLAIFKCLTVVIAAFFWCGSFFLAQLDYLSMFVTIMTSLWVAGAGAVVTFGLYWRRGTTAGAYAAVVSGGGLSLAGVLTQRNWASAVLPWLQAHGWDEAFRHALEAASRPFNPWIDWKVADALWPVKFPVNSLEISFIAGVTGALLYVAISLLTCRKPFDLEKMLHRDSNVKLKMENGKLEGDNPVNPVNPVKKPFLSRLLNSLVGIRPEFTRGDRIIAWAAFWKHIVIDWVVAFLCCSIAAKVFHWGVREWTIRAFIMIIVYALSVGVVATVWFSWGTVRDLRSLFRDLDARVEDDSDNGMVEKE